MSFKEAIKQAFIDAIGINCFVFIAMVQLGLFIWIMNSLGLIKGN